jgi:hypothetical protein
MRSVKERGMARELTPLMRRVKRAYAMERISRSDFDFIIQRLQQVEARIIEMVEYNEDGEEVVEPDGGEEAEADQVHR